MIHYFHGLFDHPSSWESYQIEGQDCLFHNLYELDEEKLSSIKIGPEDVLVGYSLGGRVAIKLASMHQYKIKKLILMSSHLGLKDEERKSRREWEEEIINLMKSNPAQDFFRYWNSLPLFSDSQSYAPQSEDVYQKSISLFQKNRLSEQKDYLDELMEIKDKVLYIFGYRDHKYSHLGWNLALKGFKTSGIHADHRVHLHSDKILKILKKEISQ